MELDQEQKRQADLLRRWRGHRGMSLQDVASSTPATVTKQAISLWEQGKRRIPSHFVEAFPAIFGVSAVTYARGPRS